jgi:hypothetical protein
MSYYLTRTATTGATTSQPHEAKLALIATTQGAAKKVNFNVENSHKCEQRQSGSLRKHTAFLVNF